MTERDRFVEAFNGLIAEGVFPSPGALNLRQGFDARRSIPGRLSGLRQEMLKDAGYVFDARTTRWLKPEPVDLGCPVCSALPDEACRTPSGKPRDDHKGREWA